MDIGSEGTQADERLAAGVLNLNATGGRFVGDKDFVLGVWGRQTNRIFSATES